MSKRLLVFVPGIVIVAIVIIASATLYKPYVPTTRSGQFTVIGNKIYDPKGNIFIVKGVTTVYGTFAGGDESGYGTTNYKNAQRDFDIQKSLGINTVRIFVSAKDNDSYHKERLHNVVSWARQRGFVVEIANSYSIASANLPWLGYLASTYNNDPYVWIEPMNEPNCSPPGYLQKCHDWVFWQTEEKEYIRIIRDAGMASPIVINTVSWSWDLSKIETYPLGDGNIIYGAHRYGNNHATFDASEQSACDKLWANLSTTHAIIVDEVGAWDFSGVRNSFAWVQSFIDYTANWVNHRGGAGLIAFVWYWSSPNTMVNVNGSLNDGGSWFNTHYLQHVKV